MQQVFATVVVSVNDAEMFGEIFPLMSSKSLAIPLHLEKLSEWGALSLNIIIFTHANLLVYNISPIWSL